MSTQYDPPGGLPWGLFALCGGSLLLNVVLVTRLMIMPTPEGATVAQAVDEQAQKAVFHDRAEPVPVAVQPKGEAPVAKTPSTLPEGVQVRRLSIEHSLARTFAEALGEEGKFVAPAMARLFAFDLDLRRDIMKGDEVEVAWRGGGPDVEIVAARYHSKKNGVLSAYLVLGENGPRWWTAEGQDASRELKHPPIEDFVQITSLLHDRPTHRGMDFKANVGTPVLAGFAGEVLRTNWNTGANGNCVEVQYRDGTLAKYLHLSQTGVKPGERVQAGAVLGLSGNTGRSTAPHLHYELEKGGKVVDPVDYHGVIRASVAPVDQAELTATVERVDRWWSEGV